jgi:hypothetical protein
MFRNIVLFLRYFLIRLTNFLDKKYLVILRGVICYIVRLENGVFILQLLIGCLSGILPSFIFFSTFFYFSKYLFLKNGIFILGSYIYFIFSYGSPKKFLVNHWFPAIRGLKMDENLATKEEEISFICELISQLLFGCIFYFFLYHDIYNYIYLLIVS